MNRITRTERVSKFQVIKSEFYRVQIEPNEHLTEQDLSSTQHGSFESNRTRAEIFQTERRPGSTRFIEQTSLVQLDRTELGSMSHLWCVAGKSIPSLWRFCITIFGKAISAP